MNPVALHSLIDRDVNRVERYTALAEAARFLHPVQQALLHHRGWLKMLAPRSYGGAELPLPRAVRLQEQIAAVDGSVGWVLTLCSGAGWFAGFLAPELARRVIGAPRACIGGSGAPTGYAEREGDGYRISGSWAHASGAPMATYFTLNAILRADGQPVLDEKGVPCVRSFIVPAAQVQVQASWRCIGMRASGTQSFRIEKQWVSEEQCFVIDAAAATSDGPLYRYPFGTLADVTLAANLCGMASHFLQLAEPCMARRVHPVTGLPLLKMPEVAALLRTRQLAMADARMRFFERLDRSWAQVEGGIPLAEDEIRDVRKISLALVGACRAAVDELYPYSGLWAAQEDSPLNRVWRDFHTASQHALLMP